MIHLTQRDKAIIGLLRAVAALIGKRKEFDEVCKRYESMTPAELDDALRRPDKCPECGFKLR